jgi:hypothetical protein
MRYYAEEDIILLAGAEMDIDEKNVTEKYILKTINDPDRWNEDTYPHTIERFFDSRTNPRTIKITFHRGHSLTNAFDLYDNTSSIVIDSIKVIKHRHSQHCIHLTDQYED